MGRNTYFCYDAEDKARFGVEEVSSDGMQPLFEIYPEELEPEEFEAVRNSGLYPDFVADFPKIFVYVDEDEPEPDEEAMIESLINGEGIEEYVEPSFDPAELVAWTTLWIENINDMDEAERKEMHFITESGFDWTDLVVDDLKQIKAQAECAERHGVTMHLEMY